MIWQHPKLTVLYAFSFSKGMCTKSCKSGYVVRSSTLSIGTGNSEQGTYYWQLNIKPITENFILSRYYYGRAKLDSHFARLTWLLYARKGRVSHHLLTVLTASDNKIQGYFCALKRHSK